ncbi:hypothetical protein ABK040_008779 [Willaertia magna]
MSKEQCMICVDNSEFMRNGDYSPSRMEAQLDAANLICGSKTQSNPETTIGVLTMGNSSPSVKVALTTDLGKLLSSLSSTEIGGKLQFTKAIKIAQLALRNRLVEQGTPNRRIVAFVGSPIEESKDDLVKLGLSLKKNNIACDVVNFGEVQENTEKLEAFIASVNKDNNSQIATIPPGPHILSDMLITSPIVGAFGGAGMMGAGVGGTTTEGGASASDFEFGVDPNVDPELAMAIRLSMEEERRRQEREKQQSSSTTATTTTTTGSSSGTVTSGEQQQQTTQTIKEPTHMEDEDIEMDEDEALQKALLMSKEETTMEDEEEEIDEDEAIQRALQMSLMETKSGKQDENIEDIVEDSEFMQDLVGSLGKNVNTDEVLKKKEDKKDEEKK